MNLTGIEWTDFSSNPLIYKTADGRTVWACEKVSPGCAHCYSATLAKRYGRGADYNAGELAKLTPMLSEQELGALLKSKKVAGKRIFLGDMTDLFGAWVPDAMLDRLFSDVLERRTDVTFQLLTKRAARMREYLTWRWGGGRLPSRHIHVGVSVENQPTADERIPLLLDTPARVRWVSYEPALGPVDFTNIAMSSLGYVKDALRRCELEPPRVPDARLDWIVVGGESGPGARPFDIAWARSTVRQGKAAGVPVFVKQLGSRPFNVYVTDDAGTFIGGAEHPGIHNRKGSDPAEWPADLRVRETPAVSR